MSDLQKIAVGVVISMMAWGGNIIYGNLKETIQENRDSIQAIIQLMIEK